MMMMSKMLPNMLLTLTLMGSIRPILGSDLNQEDEKKECPTEALATPETPEWWADTNDAWKRAERWTCAPYLKNRVKPSRDNFNLLWDAGIKDRTALNLIGEMTGNRGILNQFLEFREQWPKRYEAIARKQMEEIFEKYKQEFYNPSDGKSVEYYLWYLGKFNNGEFFDWKLWPEVKHYLEREYDDNSGPMMTMHERCKLVTKYQQPLKQRNLGCDYYGMDSTDSWPDTLWAAGEIRDQYRDTIEKKACDELDSLSYNTLKRHKHDDNGKKLPLEKKHQLYDELYKWEPFLNEDIREREEGMLRFYKDCSNPQNYSTVWVRRINQDETVQIKRVYDPKNPDSSEEIQEPVEDSVYETISAKSKEHAESSRDPDDYTYESDTTRDSIDWSSSEGQRARSEDVDKNDISPLDLSVEEWHDLFPDAERPYGPGLGTKWGRVKHFVAQVVFYTDKALQVELKAKFHDIYFAKAQEMMEWQKKNPKCEKAQRHTIRSVRRKSWEVKPIDFQELEAIVHDDLLDPRQKPEDKDRFLRELAGFFPEKSTEPQEIPEETSDNASDELSL